jgi:signal transduction histidine kinase
MERANNKLLSLINACISHELRNPLNSIIAFNIQKKELYGRLQELMKNKLDRATQKEFQKVISKLNKSLKDQDASSNLMIFNVQDFLDYAQIRAEKFKINSKMFSLKQAIVNVMSF